MTGLLFLGFGMADDASLGYFYSVCHIMYILMHDARQVLYEFGIPSTVKESVTGYYCTVDFL